MKSQAVVALFTGATAGLLGGFMGVGGGIVLVPLLVLFWHLEQHEAHGTSLAVIFPIAISGTVIYALQRHLDWRLALTLALGSMLGAMIGARLMARMPAKALKRGFAALLIALGLRLVLWGSPGV